MRTVMTFTFALLAIASVQSSRFAWAKPTEKYWAELSRLKAEIQSNPKFTSRLKILKQARNVISEEITKLESVPSLESNRKQRFHLYSLDEYFKLIGLTELNLSQCREARDQVVAAAGPVEEHEFAEKAPEAEEALEFLRGLCQDRLDPIDSD